MGPAFTATFNDYSREQIGVRSERNYVTSGNLWRKWDDSHQQPGIQGDEQLPVPNTGVDPDHAMIQSPKMRVPVQQGYFDLACTCGATQYFPDHMDLPSELRGNITVEYCPAGHMMHVEPASMRKFSEVLADFVH